MYFSGLKKWKFLSFRTRIFMFSDPLKYTSFFSLTLQNLVYFSGPKFGKIKYISFFSLTLKNLMYFSGLKKWKFLSFRTRIFMFSDPLKYTSFFFLTLQNLVYFSGPKFGKIKYISFFSLTLQNLVYFSGLTIGENPVL